MPHTGPFHSLTDASKQALADRFYRGVSVRRAASEFWLNHSHAPNDVHVLGYGHRRVTDQQAAVETVALVAAGFTLAGAVR